VTTGYRGQLFMLAFDHRASFQRLLGVRGQPTPAEAARLADAKHLILEGLKHAVGEGAPREPAGVLVDEESGAHVARAARAAGYVLAMPVERSGQDEFDFEYGADFGQHIEAFDPTFAKVLVRYNPEGDRAMNRRQAGRLKQLSEWLRARRRRLLFELLVPPERVQLQQVRSDARRFDAEVRPGLMLGALRELQEAGVEPDVWKVEGLERREDCEAIVAQARSGGRAEVACIVLGRGAEEAAVLGWLRQAGAVPGYIGFAVGRTVWEEPLRAYLAGALERTDAANAISDSYRRMVAAYTSASP
jgi:5-dehydro-2-deoxygluconokinase